MRPPALINFIDDTHCSLNCQLMNQFHQCTARGYDPDRRETLEKDASTHFLRTKYCRRMAGDYGVILEECLKCGGQCEGEHYSWKTTCTKCGTKFKRIEDQDEHYLREDTD